MSEAAGASGEGSESSMAPPAAVKAPAPAPQKRQKVVLKPGHTLADWYALARKEKNLAGSSATLDPYGGVILRKITTEEVAQHKTAEDCWIILKGRVYSISRYLDYHPGGIPKLMAVAGRDATSLFDKTHAWVNFDMLLQSCLIGVHVGPARPGFPAPPPVQTSPSSTPTPAATSSSHIDNTPDDPSLTQFPAPDGPQLRS
eukprot:TRINITY_DN6883_c0_g1_i1.p1 TRINITY_DN6883_c0_g1~~TRINITY_DN6883_c0_g1_i1.p1  ORF type:complete len:201 (-),score=27.80 TRINITY_DN6883_c0_g1_i1:53-655(-)